ncbi:yeats domain-containing protein 2 [Plakobranchus ocellatus]|uniref:YEATS domain-containing protein 2 n=1 Tax=Plakobranchus ocellatus TaxID=259542 RepID=A0AAV4BL72_9GAST|nr:yeats domain-containing protein 2 [Plakobranchus ocellatus]
MSAQKRKLEAVDPDYADVGEEQTKRQRALEKDAKESVCRKIQAIVRTEFQREISIKETELQTIDKRLNDALLLMDRLRACVVASYYGQKHPSSSSQTSSVNAPPPSIHPTVKKYIGKAPKGHSTKPDLDGQVSLHSESHERLGQKDEAPVYDNNDNTRAELFVDSQPHLQPCSSASSSSLSGSSVSTQRHARFKIKKKIIVGNVSKYIPVDNREANDMSSHKWMVYVRGPKSDPDISGFVRKVWFFLHHSYKPNDLVEISSPPFHLTRRGWGEFPVRVQLHFVDPRNKKVDIIHHLKLDKTFTGLQTLGAETVVEVEIIRDNYAEATSSSIPPPHLMLPVHQQSGTKSLSGESLTSLPSEDKREAQISVSKEEQTLRELHAVSSSGADNQYQIHHLSDKQRIQAESGIETEEEYHMTIAHEPVSAAVKREEEPDQDVDVCEDTDPGGNILSPALKLKTLIKKELDIVIKSEAGTETVSDEVVVSKIPSVSLLETETKSGALKYAGLSSLSVQSKSSTLPSTATVPPQTAPSTVSSLPSNCTTDQKPVMTIIKNPFPFRPYTESHHSRSGQAAAKTCSLTSLDSSIKFTVASSLILTSCVTTVSVTTATTAQVTASPILTATQSPISSSLKPKSTSLSSGESGQNLPASSAQQQQQKVAVSKVVVYKPNTNKPMLPAHHVIQTSSNEEKPGAKHMSAPLSSQPGLYKIKSNGSVESVVISPGQAASPLVRPAAPRQVSLLTGLVVKSQPSVSSHPTNQGGSSSSSSSSLSSSMGSSAKSNSRPEAVSIVLPSSGQSCVTTSLPAKHTVIKVLNKTPALGAAPIKLVSTSTNRLNPQSIPVSISSNYPSLLAQSNTISIAGSHGSSEIEHRICNQDVKPSSYTDHSASSSQVLLSFPGGTAVPLTHGTKPVVYEKMSAVGITKHGKGYRSILPPVGAKKVVSLEERLKGQYEVLRAFKENPELYQRKSKKVVLATNDKIDGEEDVIPKLQLEDYPTLRALVKAAVLLHPLVQADVNKLTHPYCAESIEQWNSWTIGKQRASEWHRACFTLRYLRACLGGQTEFKGQNLMSKRQLMDWCRQHAFSPVGSDQSPGYFMGQPVKEEAEDNSDIWVQPSDGASFVDAELRKDSNNNLGIRKAATSESFYQQMLRNQLQSFTLLDDLQPELSAEAERLRKIADIRPEENLNVVDLDQSPGYFKGQPVKEEAEDDSDIWIQPSDGASFVDGELRMRGVRLKAERLENGVMVFTTAEMLYRVMLEFCADVLRETLASCENCSNEITGRDVHRGLASLPEASFCCNRFLGKQDEPEFAAPR